MFFGVVECYNVQPSCPRRLEYIFIVLGAVHLELAVEALDVLSVDGIGELINRLEIWLAQA